MRGGREREHASERLREQTKSESERETVVERDTDE